MSKHLNRDLENLHRNILAMAGLVEETIQKAIQSLIQRNAELAQEVIAVDTQIDEEENLINEDCLKILALHQPVAVDLRRIVAAMMIVVDLERMGDLAEDIAERALALVSHPPIAIPQPLEQMADLAATMVQQSLDAFVNHNPQQARRTHRLDDEVDRLNDVIIQELILSMRSSPEQAEPLLSLFSATRHVERIADHATNIAEDVIYLIEGEIVRHRPASFRSSDHP